MKIMRYLQWSIWLLCLPGVACFTNPAWSDGDSPLAVAIGADADEESISDDALYAILGSARSSGLLPEVSDTTPPVPGNGGVFSTATNIGATGMDLHWTGATDDQTTQADLRYQLYFSTSDNIGTIADAGLNGTPVGGFTADITTLSTIGLLDSATGYFFNVIVVDAANNPAVYETFMEYTNEGQGGPRQ